jgi:hypothetical protein
MTPLEAYYAAKAKQQKPDELLTRQAALALLDKDPNILLKKNHPGLFMQLLDVLDRPGNATRALLVGKFGGLKGLIPFAGVLEDLTGVPFRLRKEDRVPGTELIETWFGKQPNRPGKIDTVDALGMVADIVLDPLWPVGGMGITKLAKAKKLIQGASKGLLPTAMEGMDATSKVALIAQKTKHQDAVIKAIHAASKGEPIPSDIGKYMANAIRTVYGSGQTPKLAVSWAEQAARGERAVLTIAGKPVVFGGKTFWDAAEKGTEAFRKSYIGEKLLAGYRRVAPKYDKMPEIYTHNVRDMVVAQSARVSSHAQRMGKEFADTGVPDASILTGDIHQLQGLIEKTPDQIQKEIAETLQKGNKSITKLSGHYNAIAKQRTGVEERLAEARQQYGKPLNLGQYTVPSTGGVSYNKIPPDVSVVRGRGIVRRLSKMENELNRLKFSGRREDVFKIQRLQKIIQNLEKRGLQNKDTVSYLNKVRPLEQRLRDLDNELFKTNNRITGFYKRAQDPNRRPIRRLLERQKMAEGKVGELLSTVPEEVRPKILDQVKRFKELAEGQVATERAANISVGELDSALGYMRRWLTPEAIAFKEANQDKIMFQVRATRPTGGFAKRRKGYMEDLTREEVNDIWKKSGFEGANVFEPNIHKAWAGREMESIRSKGVANAVNESARTYRVKQATRDTIPLREYYEKIGMNVPDGVDGYHIPKEIMNVFTAVKANPGGIDKFWKFWTGLNRLTKGLFTLPMPAYYMKNIIGDVALGFLDGVVDPKVYFNSIRLNIAASKTAKIAKRSSISFEEAAQQVNWPKIQTQFGEMDGREVWRMGQEHGVTGQTLGIMHISELPTGQNVNPNAGRISRFVQGHGKLWEAGRGVAETTENWTRVAHFVDKLNKGMDPASAAKQVKAFHFDYGDLSEWEKKIARDRLFFFYTFSRKNLPRQVQSLVQTPGKQAVFSHLAGGTPTIQGEGQNYPDWMQEQLIVNTPFRDKNNLPVKMFSTGLPIEEAFGRFAGPGVGVSRLRRIVARNIAQLQPAITKPIELGTGKSLYFDKPITKWGQFALEASPMGRFAGSYRQAMNPMESVPKKVSNFVTGVRARSYDAEANKQYKLKEIARKYLATHGATQSPTYYIAKDKRKNLSIPTQISLQVQ